MVVLIPLSITRAGFPTARLWGAIFVITTEPAPITQWSPIVTPGNMIERAPIKQCDPIVLSNATRSSFAPFLA